MHVSRPEVWSLPPNATWTGPLYQPAPLGLRPGVAPVTVAGVSSYFNANGRLEALPARSRQRPVTDAAPLSGSS